MILTDSYDPVQRAKDKQASRDQDEADLNSGKVTREELAKRNGFFSSLDLSEAYIRRKPHGN